MIATILEIIGACSVVGTALLLAMVACTLWRSDFADRRLSAPVSDETQTMIRDAVSDALVLDARSRRARDIHGRHQLGLDVRAVTIDELIRSSTSAGGWD